MALGFAMSRRAAFEQTVTLMMCLCLQDKLLLEQQGLRDQLKKAMELHLHPKTSVDTATIADKVISMFDEILQARRLPHLQMGPSVFMRPFCCSRCNQAFPDGRP